MSSLGMRSPLRTAAAAAALLLGAACNGTFESTTGGDDGPGDGPDTSSPPGRLDKDAARTRFVTTTDLVRYVTSPGCAAERNECHNSEDFPDLSTEGNLWNLVDQGCNQGLGERTEVEDFCEAQGDEIRIEDGANAGMMAIVGSITTVLDADGEFMRYEVRIDRPVPQSQVSATFTFVRGGAAVPGLGGGPAAELAAGESVIYVTDAGAIPDPGAVRQGDENQNGVFGAGLGALIRAGDARESYLVRRLLGHGTSRVRMPLDSNADQDHERQGYLTRNEMYAIMSWINCMQPGDGVYSPIRYDCPENADNEGQW